MPVHFDPRSGVVPGAAKINQQQSPVPVQKRLFFGDSLEIRGGETGSWLDCFKNCFQAVWDFIQRVFCSEKTNEPQKTRDNIQTPAGDGVHPRPVPAPKVVNQGVYLREEFRKRDYDFFSMSNNERGELLIVENECDYPKLALYLSRGFDIDLFEAARRINAVQNKYPDRNTMTPEFVMQWY